MKKYIAEVHRRKSAFSNDWYRTKDIIIYARNRDSAYNKLDKIGRKMANDYCRINCDLKEIKDEKEK